MKTIEYVTGEFPFHCYGKIKTGILCQKTNHFFPKTGEDVNKYTLTLLANDSAFALGLSPYFVHIIETLPVAPDKSNGLMKNLAESFKYDFKRYGLKDIAVIN